MPMTQLIHTAEQMAVLASLVEAAPTAEVRAQRALEAWQYATQTVAPAAAAARRSAFRELRALGYSLSEIAELTGITDSRVAQIIKGPE